MQRGYTLAELVVAMLLATILTSWGILSITGLRNRLLVRHEAARLYSAFSEARHTSLRYNVRTELIITRDSLALYRLEGNTAAAAWIRPGPARHGVDLSGLTTPITFDPHGYTIGLANRTITLSKGNAQRRLVISRLGRLRITP